MRTHRWIQTLLFAFVLFAGGAPVSTAPAPGQAAVATLSDGIAISKPESVGFSSESLKELDAAMQGIVDAKHLAGVVTLVARHGKVVQHKAYGMQDIASQAPMQLDSIVRIYSMTKPMAGAAMMMLYEEGKWLPTRSDRQAHPGVREPQGVHGDGRQRPADPRRADASADDGRADVAQCGFHLRPVRQLAGRQDVPGRQSVGRAVAAGVHRARSPSCRCCTSQAKSGSTASRSTSRVIWSRSCPGRRSRISCAIGSSPRSG